MAFNLDIINPRDLSIGVARASLTSLDFVKGRDIDNRIVDSLVGPFCKDSRLEPENYLPVIITVADLGKALDVSKVSRDSLSVKASDGIPCLLKPGRDQKFLCLHGRHRIKAAETVLTGDDNWWTIRIYLLESHSRDGEIYWNIRRNPKDKSLAKILTARLSSCKQVAFRQLIKHKKLAAAFDALLDFPGPWIGLEFGNIQRILAMRCDEVRSISSGS
jgi:hypothetical protein